MGGLSMAKDRVSILDAHGRQNAYSQTNGPAVHTLTARDARIPRPEVEIGYCKLLYHRKLVPRDGIIMVVFFLYLPTPPPRGERATLEVARLPFRSTPARVA